MTTITPATKKMLALSMLQGVGPATLRKVVAQSLVFASEDALCDKIPAIARALSAVGAWEIAQDLAEMQCDAARKADARIISALDEGYPSLLSSTKDDPFLLYVRGQLSLTPDKSVAIIGTREPTKHGELITRRITEFFTSQGWSIVSGLALGCDALAHRAAIESNGHTVAVLAHGLQTVAPSQHRKLAQQILDTGGALVSEYRFGQGALPTQFVKRDRTQAGLAQGVVMIQSDLKGGSLHASRAALDYDRWLAVPFPTDADHISNAPKIQANLLMADEAADIERATLLKCHRSKLSRLIILRTKYDYSHMVTATFGGEDGVPSSLADELGAANDISSKKDNAGLLTSAPSQNQQSILNNLEFGNAPQTALESNKSDTHKKIESEQKLVETGSNGYVSGVPEVLKSKAKPKAKPKLKAKPKSKNVSKAELTEQQDLL